MGSDGTRELIMATALELFSKKGYKVRKIQPFDLFCHTAHVETVVLLNNKFA